MKAIIGAVIIIACICVIIWTYQPRKKTNQTRMVLPDDVIDPDPHMRETAAAAFNSGKIVVGRTTENGKLEIEYLDIEEEPYLEEDEGS